MVEKLLKVRLFLSHSTKYLFTVEFVIEETVLVKPKGRGITAMLRMGRSTVVLLL